ncbi:hypothetical protein M0R45_020571 [Rubus argutus]|uniref:Potassium channel domain-containing protein n=1 Tax=Rubus argutus TaxID=59490 RepID=A0AAW1XC00_RUBAR
MRREFRPTGAEIIRDLKTQAIVVAAPFSFTLGLLASIFAIQSRIYVWTCAALEFGLVALTAHLFYYTFHLWAVYSILLASVVGFGDIHKPQALNSLYMQYFTWRVQVAQNNSSPV